ncbi:hypothetical protein AB0K27_27885 [Micromonospora echinospora]|uniref:hypothetical protein n=1 Tax=Micromonospora echinospora TaxID=1877 RepID=UPI0034376B62
MTGFVEAVISGGMSEVRSALAGLDEPARRALGDELVAEVRRRRDAWWWQGEAATLAVAAVGTLSTPTKVAALLGRRSVWLSGVDAAPVVDVARERGVTWLADVAYKLADRLPRDRMVAGWRFVAGLLLAEKAPPPTGDDFVRGWAAAQGWPAPRGTRLPTVDRLRADPFLDALLPRLFEVDGVGTELARGDGAGTDSHALPRALAALAAEGRLDRAELLNGVLGRLLRGDRPGALRPFLALHDLLAPAPDEVAVRSNAYLRLLTDGPGPVARAAQRTLREAGDAAEPEALWEAARTVLARPEKALVRAQVSWLDRLARQHPDQAAEIGAVLAVAADHPDAGLRERALTLAQRHGHRPVAVATVVEARDDLPPPLPAAAAPPPIDDVDELVEEVAAALRGQWPTAVLERVVDGLVRLGTRERDRVAAALGPVLRRAQVTEYHQTWARFLPAAQVNGLLLAAAGIGDATRRRDHWASVLATSRSAEAASGRPAPMWLYRLRLAEAGQRLDGHDDPGLLSAPTSATGAIEPQVLYERLAAFGARPYWQWDCGQAFLRLPADVDEPLAARAEALGTTAGIELAAWLRGEIVPVPAQEVVTVGRRERSRGHDWIYDSLPERRRLVALTPSADVDDRFGLITLTPPTIGTRMFGAGDLWPAVLPGHRGVVAAQVLPELAMAAQEDLGGRGPVLLALAECTGAGGPALDLAVAYGLCARHEADRVAALDALLLLAAAGDLDAPAVGGHLGEIGAQGQVILTRAVTPLRDALAAGARLSVWRLLAAALPPLLAEPTPPRGTPDLLALAAEAATATGIRIEVPGLADVVARGGGSRLVAEARRLAGVLAV